MGKQIIRKIALVTGVAAIVGYVAGILTAPKSGKETREDIKDMASSSLTEAERELKQLSAELNAVVEQATKRGKTLSAKASEELSTLVETAKSAREKVREVVSAVHEGDAEDEDLHVAVMEANRALKHLRTYLQK